ncbi:hypothetical protein F4859DRAFT_458701 [Xylaria cf. heliscus]|nr:hypothetical protein F4859DRAFT_458701 [Xylaria cf. heliscus]
MSVVAHTVTLHHNEVCRPPESRTKTLRQERISTHIRTTLAQDPVLVTYPQKFERQISGQGNEQHVTCYTKTALIVESPEKGLISEAENGINIGHTFNGSAVLFSFPGLIPHLMMGAVTSLWLRIAASQDTRRTVIARVSYTSMRVATWPGNPY